MNLVKLLLITFPVSAFAEDTLVRDALVKGLGIAFAFTFIAVIFVVIRFLISLFKQKTDGNNEKH
jgi:hypothetical protein